MVLHCYELRIYDYSNNDENTSSFNKIGPRTANIYTLYAESREKVSRFATFYVCFDSLKHKISAFWITN